MRKKSGVLDITLEDPWAHHCGASGRPLRGGHQGPQRLEKSMKRMGRRGRLGAFAASLAAVGGGLSGLLGDRGLSAISNRYLLAGVSVGVTVGVTVQFLSKMKVAESD